MKLWPWLFLVSFLFNSNLLARDSDWFEGVIVLENHEVLLGELKIEAAYSLVQLKNSGSIRCIHAREIEQIKIHDTSINSVRTIISVRSENPEKSSAFYELIVRGEVNLLASYNDYRQFAQSDITKQKETPVLPDDMQFYYFDGKTLISSRCFRKEVFPVLLKLTKDHLEDFILQNRIQIDVPADQIRLLKQFNLIYSSGKLLARH